MQQYVQQLVYPGAVDPKKFRFAMGLWPKTTRKEWHDAVHQAERLGFDTVVVADHLGTVPPLPGLVSAAQVSSLTVGTYVLNTGFYRPALLARDVAGLEMLSDGRFELGLGAGYVREEFEAAGLAFRGGASRVAHLEQCVDYLRTQGSKVPILVAGSGNRLLTAAAQYGDIVSIAGAHIDRGTDQLAERVEFVREIAGSRFDSIVFNLSITAVAQRGVAPDLSLTRLWAMGGVVGPREAPTMPDRELWELPGVLSGSARDMADKLRHLRDSYGISYFTVQEFHAEAFGEVIAELS